MGSGKTRRHARAKVFKNRIVLVTAGPTVEDIDPVRFISNRSTGRMGVSIASEAARRGAHVLLIHGPLQIPAPRDRKIELIPVRSARQMYRAVMARVRKADIAILCAAVADFTPAKTAARKLKKGKTPRLRIDLIRTPDILEVLGARKRRPLLVGFAAETENVARNAKEKLLRKNCDMICANDVLLKGSGFGSRTNRVTLYRKDKNPKRLPLLSKVKVAAGILNEIEQMQSEKRPCGRRK